MLQKKKPKKEKGEGKIQQEKSKIGNCKQEDKKATEKNNLQFFWHWYKFKIQYSFALE